MGPIDYMGQMPQQDFLKNVLGGLQVGAAIQQNELLQRQQQAALQRAQDYRADIGAAMQSPTPQAFSALALKYPEHREAFKQGWDTLNADQQQSELRDGATIAAALHSGRPDLATQQIQDRITATKNSGQPTKPYEDLLQLVKDKPDQAYGHVLGVMAGIPGGDKILSNLSAIGTEKRAGDLAQPTLDKAVADAKTAGSDATIKGVQAAAAPVTTELGNRKTAQEIAKSQADAKVAEFNAQIAAANSDTQRGQLTLERDKYIQEQAKLQQTQSNAAQDSMDSVAQALGTVQQIKNHPSLSSGVGFGSDFKSWFAGSAGRDVRSMVDTLKSQQFLTAVKQMTGTGSLSDAEGARIERAVASLDAGQSENQFRNSLGIIENSLVKAQQKLVARGQLPTTGGAYVATVPGIGTVDEGHVNKILKANPGSTREQVIQYLQSVGGK
jgi:hypothetical protein